MCTSRIDGRVSIAKEFIPRSEKLATICFDKPSNARELMFFEAAVMGKFHRLQPVLCVSPIPSHVYVRRLAHI